MSRLCFVDTETTGLAPHFNEVWEIAIIERRHDGAKDLEHLFHVRPDLTRADPAALRIGRFYERTACFPGEVRTNSEVPPADPTPGRSWQPAAVVAGRVARLLDGAHLVASNPAFDAAFLNRFLHLNGHAGTWHYHLIDVAALALGYLHADGQAPALPWSSNELGRLCGVPQPSPEAKHTALGDARWVRDVYDAITSRPEVCRAGA